MTLLMAVMWLSYEITHSAFFLSVMLTFSAILPLVLKKFSRLHYLPQKLNLLALSLPQLMLLRIGIYISLSVIVLLCGNSVFGLLLFGLLTGLLSITILSSYEARNTQFVLEKQIEKSFSARVMQTVIQVGAFAGAMLGSLMLNHIGFANTVWIISVLDIGICSVLFYFESNTHPVPSSVTQTVEMDSPKRKIIYMMSGLLGLIALYISTFNFSVPIIFQTVNHWSITDFGIASGMAGVAPMIFQHCYQPDLLTQAVSCYQ